MKQVLGTFVLATAMSLPLAAQRGPHDVSIGDRARGAERVVVATVVGVTSEFSTNDYGDQLIVSHAQLRVDESLKGAGPASFVLDVEGGTVGEITLQVSDMPVLNRGERAVVFVTSTRSGRKVPHMRNLGVLKLDSADMVRGTSIPLAEVKRQIHAK
jgi:hypothetical protein